MNTARQRAIDYVLGLADAAERDAVARARRTDPALEAAIVETERLLAQGQVALAAPGTLSDATPDALFARVMADIARLAPARPWHEPRPGVALRGLWDERTFLIRCRAGTLLPAHVHDREERTVLLDGDLRIGTQHLATGRCERMPAGSAHEDAQALRDCLMLVQYG